MSQSKTKGLAPRVASLRLVLASAIFALALPAAASASSTSTLRDGDLQKAERIIAKLHRLEQSADFRAYKKEAAGLYPRLFVEASELRESDLKTDLSTAVFLYESAYRNGADLVGRRTDCGAEMRELYLKLCRENQGGDSFSLLLSKARLHTRWGEVAVHSYRGATDAETLRELSEIEAERKIDIALAERAVATLKGLAARVSAFSSERASGNALRGDKLSSEQLSWDCSETLSEVDRILASLPRSRLRLLLHNACGSYRDGFFWRGKTQRLQGRAVSVNNLAEGDPLKILGLPASEADEATLANWRSALKYTAEAERVVCSLKA